MLEEDAEQQKLTEANLKSQVQSLEKLVENNKTMNETLSHSIMTEDNSQLMNELCSLQNENVRPMSIKMTKKKSCAILSCLFMSSSSFLYLLFYECFGNSL